MELFLLVLREGIEFAILLILLASVHSNRIRSLIASSAAVIAAGVLCGVVLYPPSGPVKSAGAAFMHWSFVFLLLLSLPPSVGYISYIATLLLFFIPSFQTVIVVIDAAQTGSSSIYALAGILLAAALFGFALKHLSMIDMRRYLDERGVYVVLAAICFLTGGVTGFEHLPVVTGVQQGLAAFLSSFVPFLRAELLIPAAGTLVSSKDGFFEYLSSERMALALTALVLFMPPVVSFVRLILSPEPDTSGVEKKAVRRKLLSIHRDELLRRGTPLFLALIVSVILLHAANLSARPSYDPEPVPVISEGDVISIPLKDRLGDVADGKIRKYSISDSGEVYRFLVIMRPDGEVVAALDACEVCPPRGYVQRGGHVICTYCNTPIPVSSIGRPGGCNPIPISSETRGDTLILKKSEIVSAYHNEAGKEAGAVLR